MKNFLSHRICQIRYKKHAFRVELADSFLKRALGLMWRKRLGPRSGMLFTSGRDAKNQIWMLNMRFPIDILWLDANGRIVSIAKNAPPAKSIFSCRLYGPRARSRYVLELQAGTVDQARMRKGQKMLIEI